MRRSIESLLAMEQTHAINLQGAPVYTRTLSEAVFGEMSRRSVIATDPGAGFRHGAYTHRIQWWVVLNYADRLTHRPAELVMRAIDPQLKPPEANWPQQSEITGVAGPQPVAENRSTLWDALFDRTVPQIYSQLFNMGALGISHPELFTDAIIKGRVQELVEVAAIIRAQVDARWGGSGNKADALKLEATMTSPTYRQHREGVYLRA